MFANRQLLLGVVAVVALVAGMVIALPFNVVPRGELAPSFIMTDAFEQPLWSKNLRGHVALYHFTYTRCGAACAQQTNAMQTLQRRIAVAFAANDPPVTLVSVSFDPDYDTGAVLRSYARLVGAQPQHWRIITGPPDVLKGIIGDGFKVYYQKEASDTFTFDSTFVLVDDQGFIRARYRTNTLDVERVMRDIGLVVKEVQESTGVRRYAYDAAHLFVCSVP